MPKMEPMLASATEVSTPSSRSLTVSRASEKSMRSCMSLKGTVSKGISEPARVKCSRRPGHREVRLPSSP